MNKRNIITVAVCLVAVCLVLVVKYHPRTLPIEECSQVYKDYADDPHVAVAFIKDFPVNDTIRVDVTTLRALDSTGWHSLMLYFGYTEEMMENYYEFVKQMMNRPIHQFVSFYVEKNDFRNRVPLTDSNCLLVTSSYKDQTFSIYHTDNIEIKNIIAKTELKKLKPKNNESEF